jgi:hypothetical protein
LYTALLVVNGSLLPKDAVDPRRISWSKCPQPPALSLAAPSLNDCITLLTDKSALRRDIEGRLKWLGLPDDVGALLPQPLKATCHDEIAAEDRTDFSWEAHGGIAGPERHVAVTFRVCTYRA